MTTTTSGETTGSTLESTGLADGTVAELLADRQRRYLLRTLGSADGDASLTALAYKLAAWETEQSVADVSNAAVERVHVSLYHNHVLRLADAGLVEYDPDADAAALTEDGAVIAPANRDARAET